MIAMRIDAVYFVIAVTIGLLLSYGLWSMAGDLAWFIAVGATVYLSVTLGFAFGVRHDNPRTRVNLSAVSGIFFAVGLGLNLMFCFAGNTPVIYIVMNAIAFLIYLGVFHFFQNAKQ